MVCESRKKPEIYRSTIRKELLHLTLKKGAVLGSSGALLLILGGTFLPLDVLQWLGIPLFLTGLAFIAIGWLPYRQLTRLQLKPHEIHFDGETLLFLKQGKPLFKISETSIDSLTYVENKNLYGLAIQLKKPLTEKVIVLQRRFDFASFITDNRNRFDNCDLFLPFFSQTSCSELQHGKS